MRTASHTAASVLSTHILPRKCSQRARMLWLTCVDMCHACPGTCQHTNVACTKACHMAVRIYTVEASCKWILNRHIACKALFRHEMSVCHKHVSFAYKGRKQLMHIMLSPKCARVYACMYIYIYIMHIYTESQVYSHICVAHAPLVYAYGTCITAYAYGILL